MAGRPVTVVEQSLLSVNLAHDEANELLCEKDYPNSTIVLVRSAGDTWSHLEEIWFRDEYDRKIIATLIPQERKQMNGQEVKWTKVEFEYGW